MKIEELQIGNPSAIHWCWLAIACSLVMALAWFANRKRLRGFASDNLIGRLVPKKSMLMRLVPSGLVTCAILLISISLMDLRWGKVWREIPQKGIEVMFVLDVSRSMLAEDATPNRLARAKQQIRDLLDVMPGDRVGLVAFAGDVRQIVPITSHFDDFRRSLSDVTTTSVRRGGSRLGDAIRVATEGFLTKTSNHKAMVIFTDGEDQESHPIDMAQRAFSKHGIRIFTVGLGDMSEGARIPVSTQNARGKAKFLQHRGEQVWSKLDGTVLKKIAEVSQGAFIPAGTKQVDMSGVYHQYIAAVDQQEFDTAKINQYEARFQLFLAPAVLCLILQLWMVGGRK